MSHCSKVSSCCCSFRQEKEGKCRWQTLHPGALLVTSFFLNHTSLLMTNLANASGWQVLHDESISIDEVGVKSIHCNSLFRSNPNVFILNACVCSHKQSQLHTRVRPRLDSTLCGPKGREDQRTVRDKYSLRLASGTSIVKREPVIKSEKNYMCKNNGVNRRVRPGVKDVSAQTNDSHEDFCHNCSRRCGMSCDACCAKNVIFSRGICLSL